MRDFSFRENPSYETYHRDHISYFSKFVMLEVSHVIISEMLSSGKFPKGAATLPGKKHSWNYFLKS